MCEIQMSTEFKVFFKYFFLLFVEFLFRLL